MTTIRSQSFAGLGMAPLAFALALSGGLAWLSAVTPASASAAAAEAVGTVCAAPATPSDAEQFTAAAGDLDAPDSCDDDDDDDDATSGSDAAVTADRGRSTHFDGTSRAVHFTALPLIARHSEGPSLRGPPALNPDPNDVDDDDDDDDDDSRSPERFAHASVDIRTPHLIARADFLRAISIASSRSLRAPPRL